MIKSYTALQDKFTGAAHPMAYHYEWLQPNRVIFCCVYNEQTVAEMVESGGKLMKLLDEGTAPTHYIVDARYNTMPPTTNVREFRKLISFTSHAHLGWVIAIVRNPILIYIFALLAKLTRARYRAVEAPEDALELLHRIDATIAIDIDLDALVNQIRNQPKAAP